ncbi:phosphatase PAP2 family protein [Ferrimonas pelagia]|uniref:undecaprenyl-diphosphate phosphatase n=1 Tax=Ferrimonas pelagia TaxID=1177826 RepID=A0ABP9FDJ2_9GAMM
MKPLALITSCVIGTLSLSAHASTSEDLAQILRFGLPAAAAATSWAKDDSEGLWQFGISFAASSATALALKSSVDAERPDGSSNDSFPSGHATNTFAAASYLQQRYGWEYGVPAYALASWTAVSRVNTDHHRWGDVLAGAALGMAFSYWLVDPYSPVQLTPLIGKDSVMLTGSIRF